MQGKACGFCKNVNNKNGTFRDTFDEGEIIVILAFDSVYQNFIKNV